jgi:hypothetical protein
MNRSLILAIALTASLGTVSNAFATDVCANVRPLKPMFTAHGPAVFGYDPHHRFLQYYCNEMRSGKAAAGDVHAANREAALAEREHVLAELSVSCSHVEDSAVGPCSTYSTEQNLKRLHELNDQLAN